ncbi:MAG: hypothetical protein RBS47_14800, partial [Hydrogenophaga sp.]|uniref:hypothetical protein n=1 Tax=Hydrogenophaga sp. TaxID=1904254 RepID=UPI002A35E8DD
MRNDAGGASMLPVAERPSLSRMLVASGLVSQVVIDYARQKQAVEGRQLGRMLVELGFLSAKDL